jgi:DNA-directed RNA polymerase beta' subunit
MRSSRNNDDSSIYKYLTGC